MDSLLPPCKLCLHYTGKNVIHTMEKGCPAAKNAKCRRCHNRGHFASDCNEGYAHWERPTCYEELIPVDLRIKYGIGWGTLPEMVFPKPRGVEGTFHELDDDTNSNTIVLPHFKTKEFYEKAGEVIKLYNIPIKTKTKESAESRLKAIDEWCINHGRHLIHVAPATDEKSTT